jgi:hypothetical protein
MVRQRSTTVKRIHAARTPGVGRRARSLGRRRDSAYHVTAGHAARHRFQHHDFRLAWHEPGQGPNRQTVSHEHKRARPPPIGNHLLQCPKRGGGIRVSVGRRNESLRTLHLAGGHQAGRVQAAAPGGGPDPIHAHAAGAQSLAERLGLCASQLIQVPLRRAVVDLEAGRVAALAGDVPGALPWRMRATWPPATSAPQASVASWAAPAGVMVNDTARAARASRARRRAMPRSIITRPGAMPRSIMTPSRPRLFIRVTTIDLLAVSTNTGGHVRHRVPAETGAGRAYGRASPSVRPPPRNSTPHCAHRDDGAHPSTLSRVRGGQWVVAGRLTDRRVLV